jgi:hypothetical protein
MKPTFDIVEAIYEQIVEFLFATGHVPGRLVLSPISYRRLLEIRRDAPGSLLSLATIEIVIDEVLPDTEILVAD